MFKEGSLKNYFVKMGVQYPHIDQVCKELVEATNKYNLYASVNKLSRKIFCYGNLTFSNGTLEYIIPISIDIPPEYPNYLPKVQTSLVPVPSNQLFDPSGVINYLPIMGTQNISLVAILDMIVEKSRTLVLSDFPFRPANPNNQPGVSVKQSVNVTGSPSVNQSFTSQHPMTNSPQILSSLPPPIKPSVPQHQPMSNMNNMNNNQNKSYIPLVSPNQQMSPYPNMQQMQNMQPLQPMPTLQPSVPQMPNMPMQPNTQNPPFVQPQVIVPKAKEIIVETQTSHTFDNIDKYLDQIDAENELSNYKNLLKTNVITQDEFKQLTQEQTKKTKLPSPPPEYQQILLYYRQGVISRAEAKHQIPSSNKSNVVIKNMKDLDQTQKTFAEMFITGKITKEEMNKLNYDYIMFCRNQVNSFHH